MITLTYWELAGIVLLSMLLAFILHGIHREISNPSQGPVSWKDWLKGWCVVFVAGVVILWWAVTSPWRRITRGVWMPWDEPEETWLKDFSEATGDPKP